MKTDMNDRELLELAAKAAAAQLSYDPDTGEMLWMAKTGNDQETRRWNSRYAGKAAGCIDERGYVRIVIRMDGAKRVIRGHQLAWLIVHGALPLQEIDHINHVKSDNRIINLRDVSRSVNQRNKPMLCNNTSGFTGVTRSRGREKWEAYARNGGKRVYLGLFDDPASAGQAAETFRSENGYAPMHGVKHD